MNLFIKKNINQNTYWGSVIFSHKNATLSKVVLANSYSSQQSQFVITVQSIVYAFTYVITIVARLMKDRDRISFFVYM